MTPVVSVLIPVYNAEKYLDACLDSLSKQTFSNFEIICLDDGSQDSSAKVLQAAVRREPRLRVISQPNAGVAAARNRLLSEARGKYAAFVDADDWVRPEYLQALYEAAEAADADVSKCFFEEYDCVSGRFQPARCSRHFYDEPGPLAADKLLCGYYDSIVWGKLWKLDFLRRNALCFLPGRVAEDLSFAMLGFCLADKIVLVRRVLYVYRKGVEGAITSGGIRMRADRLHNLLYLAENLKCRGSFSPKLAGILCRLVVWNFASWRRVPAVRRAEYEPLFTDALQKTDAWIKQSSPCWKLRFECWRAFAGRKFNRRFYFWSKVFR